MKLLAPFRGSRARSPAARRRVSAAAPGSARAGRSSSPPRSAPGQCRGRDTSVHEPSSFLNARQPRSRAREVLVDVAVVVDPLDELLDELLVPLIRRADEEVDAGADCSGPCATSRDLVDVDLRIQPLLFCDAVHLRRVLVRAGEEERVLASLPVMAHEDVRRERRGTHARCAVELT